MADRPLWQLSATELSEHTRAGDISARDSIQSALHRMEQVNPSLNAVVVPTAEMALDRATALDQLPADARGPLHGVPVTIKINVDQKGEATSNGVAADAGRRAGTSDRGAALRRCSQGNRGRRRAVIACTGGSDAGWLQLP